MSDYRAVSHVDVLLFRENILFNLRHFLFPFNEKWGLRVFLRV
jgi:hypothetical protein